jgi:hypothetical protein
MGKGKALPHALRGDQPFSTVEIPPGGSPILCEAASLKSLDLKQLDVSSDVMWDLYVWTAGIRWRSRKSKVEQALGFLTSEAALLRGG